MNLDHKEQRLKKLLEDNIREGKVGTAIAITGSWGVGKTYFWNKFREDHKFKNKYIYVSLFGLESLGDLKTHIYSNIENNHSLIEIPRWIRGLPSILKDTRVSQFGMNASAKVFDSLMFHQVKNAIICFDDFERMSNKLDIKDVMGLANQLKLEKNCQVILILDEAKTEDENKKKYADYKEKLIDETIKITSVEPLIRANTEDLDEGLVDLMVKFAEVLEIHNFRFFGKVIKLYRQFKEQLPQQVTSSTKEIILVRVLQGYLIDDFPKLEYTWDDSEYFTEKSRETWSDVKKSTYSHLYKISYAFVKNDLWLIEFKNWFEQKDQSNNRKLVELAQSELINEDSNRKKNEFNQLFEQFWGLTIDDKFSVKIYESSKNVIGLEGLNNLSFALTLLENFNEYEKANLLEKQILEWLKETLIKNRRALDHVDAFGEVRQSFIDFIKEFREKNELIGLPQLIEVIHQYLIIRAWNPEDTLALEHATKEDWEKLLFKEVQEDKRFIHLRSSQIVNKMINQSMKPELNPMIKKMIIKIYEEKGQKSEFYKKYMDYLISRLDN